MDFWPSFMRSTYCSKETSLPSDLDVSNRRSLARRTRLLASSMMPSLMALPKFFQNFSYLVSSTSVSSPSGFSPSSSASFPSSASLRSMSKALRTSFFLMVFKLVCC